DPSRKCSGPASFHVAERHHRLRAHDWVATPRATRLGSFPIPTGRASSCSSMHGVGPMPEIKGVDLVPVDFDPFVDTSNVTLPLTPQQSEVWVESQMGREASCAFNQCFVLRLRGPLSVASMQKALDQVVSRHAALRACFDKEGGTQRILPLHQVELAFEDVTELGEIERQQAIERILTRETEEPFDLVNGPLLRAKVVREAADFHHLILTVHHIVCDGWSSS